MKNIIILFIGLILSFTTLANECNKEVLVFKGVNPNGDTHVICYNANKATWKFGNKDKNDNYMLFDNITDVKVLRSTSPNEYINRINFTLAHDQFTIDLVHRSNEHTVNGYIIFKDTEYQYKYTTDNTHLIVE